MAFEPFGSGKKSWPSREAYLKELAAFRKRFNGLSKSEISREWHAMHLPEGFQIPKGIEPIRLSKKAKAMMPHRRIG